jgi:hypothetical protein
MEAWLREELDLVIKNYKNLNESGVALPIEEAVYKGRKVPLRKIMRGDVKKFKVYVKSGDRVLKINFGHGGSSAKAKSEKTMEIKRDNPERRKAFRARFNCDNPGPDTSARYWSCKTWSNKKVSDLLKEIISEELETYLN